ncbi:hypothetical protein WMZ97_09655 [Lentibacillus sp. N15]|uniref:hypothetical protein n=1 Tax=Lentibacillus songyuanensis TaxID=3136161 RepID=UPI0031BA9A60
MEEKQIELLNKIRSMHEKVSQLEIDYFKAFSFFGNWQFWIVILMLVVPLIVLFLFIDKDKMLLLGFFGLNYHIWFAYTNVIQIDLGYINYPYHSFPLLTAFSLDASLVPVCFMLLYQWTLNHKKNFYLYQLLLSVVLAFILKPIMVQLHLFQMHNGLSYFQLLIAYVVLFVVSKLITNLFLWLQQKNNT